MASLQEQINNDLKQAMRDKNELVLSTLRMLLAAIKNKAIAMRDGNGVELTDEQIQEAVATEIKKRQDSIESYTAGNRPELAEKERAEAEILKKYLPEQATDEDIEEIVKEVIAAGAAEFGRAMGQAMARLKGKADGKRVGEMVKKLIGGSL